MKSQMDLVAIVVVNVLLVTFIYLASFEPLRVGLGVLLVMLLPGYGVVSAMFPRGGNLDGVERIAVGFGLSLALVPLLGIAIHFSPWDLNLASIVLTLTVWTFVFIGIALWRRRTVRFDERFNVDWTSAWSGRATTLRPIDLVVRSVLILLVVGGAGFIAWKVQSGGESSRFTEFYILGATGTIKDYPTTLRVGKEQSYNIGIINREMASIEYTIRVYIDNTIAGSLGPLVLDDGEKWEGRIVVLPLADGIHKRLEMGLFRDNSSDIYQTVNIFVDVLP